MRNIKDSLKLFRFNLGRIIVFEIILQVVSASLLIPFCYTFPNLIIRLSGIKYLSRENVSTFLKSPFAWFGLLIFLIVVTFFLLVNAAGLSICYDWANHTKRIGLIRMLALSVRHAARIFIPHNFPMVFFLLCYLPVTGVFAVGMALLNFRLPRYIGNALLINKKITVIIVIVYLLLNIATFIYVFAIHVFVIRKVDFIGAMRIARRILYKKIHRVLPGLFLVTVFMLGVTWGLHYFLTGPSMEFLLKIKGAGFVVGFVFESANMVLYILYMIVGIPVIKSFIVNSFYNNVPDESREKNIDDYVEENKDINRKRRIKIVFVILMVAIILDVTFYVLIKTNVLVLDADIMNRVTITAHRGSSKKAPENSLSAFEAAIEDGADVIELDVRQTRDGVVIVMHDESLRRTCGVNNKVGEMTYRQLQGIYIDAGHGDEYPEEKIPTLREAIELIDGRADMNIELKPAVTDTNLEEAVAEIVAEYDLYDSCVVTSQTYDSIKKIKKKDENIKTVYVMSVAMGNFYNLKYADALSIKFRYITHDVVRRAHESGKEIYAWVIDDDKTLERMMLLNVDSIITNKPEQMKKNMYRNIYGDTLFEYINMYLESSY